MIFNDRTLQVGGKLRLPDHHMNSTDYAVIRDMTKYGIYVAWNPGTPYEQKAYVSFIWLNYKYGSVAEKPPFDDPIPNMC